MSTGQSTINIDLRSEQLFNYKSTTIKTQVEKCGQLILMKISKFDATTSHFKAKMHQIRFPLGLCPRPRWGAYSAPQTSSCI